MEDRRQNGIMPSLNNDFKYVALEIKELREDLKKRCWIKYAFKIAKLAALIAIVVLLWLVRSEIIHNRALMVRTAGPTTEVAVAEELVPYEPTPSLPLRSIKR